MLFRSSSMSRPVSDRFRARQATVNSKVYEIAKGGF